MYDLRRRYRSKLAIYSATGSSHGRGKCKQNVHVFTRRCYRSYSFSTLRLLSVVRVSLVAKLAYPDRESFHTFPLKWSLPNKTAQNLPNRCLEIRCWLFCSPAQRPTRASRLAIGLHFTLLCRQFWDSLLENSRAGHLHHVTSRVEETSTPALGQSDAPTTMGYNTRNIRRWPSFCDAPQADADSWLCLNFGPKRTSVVEVRNPMIGMLRRVGCGGWI